MKKIVLLISAILLIGTFSCKRGIYSGFERMENGAYMKLHSEHSDSTVATQQGDLVIFDLFQYTSDSVYFNSYVFERPLTVWLPQSDFEGDVYAALLNLTSGDSATLVFAIDSLYEYKLLTDKPLGVDGQPFYSEIKVHEVVPHDKAIASYEAYMQECKDKEQMILDSFMNEKKARRTESGLIVVDIKNNKGKKVVDGDFALLHTTMINLTNNGDTLLHSYDAEPLLVHCNQSFIGGGYDEALNMLSQGAKGVFVIPSSLRGADSAYIEEPYSVVYAEIDIVKVFTAAEYEQYMEEQNNKKQRFMEQRIIEEAIKIDEYLRKNSINVEPTENGVYYIETSKGSGDEIKVGDKVRLHYTIYNLEGESLESSFDYGEPIEFVYGVGNMLPGVEEALSYMRVGGSARAILPPMMSFGDYDYSAKLPAFSTTVFDLFLAGVEHK